MKKLLFSIISLIITVFTLSIPILTWADPVQGITVATDPTPLYANQGDTFKVMFTAPDNTFNKNTGYFIQVHNSASGGGNNYSSGASGDDLTKGLKTSDGKTLVFQVTHKGELNKPGTIHYKLTTSSAENPDAKTILTEGDIQMFPSANVNGTGEPKLALNPDSCNVKQDQQIKLEILNAQVNQHYSVWWDGNKTGYLFNGTVTSTDSTISINGKTFPVAVAVPDFKPDGTGSKMICLSTLDKAQPALQPNCDNNLTINIDAGQITPQTCGTTGVGVPGQDFVFNPTEPPVNPPPCAAGKLDPTTSQCGEFDSAIGPIQPDPVKFISNLFRILLGLSGGIAVVLIIYSGFRLATAGADEKAVQGARETINAAIIGLLFLIFSFVILEVIGVDILHIPGINDVNRSSQQIPTAKTNR